MFKVTCTSSSKRRKSVNLCQSFPLPTRTLASLLTGRFYLSALAACAPTNSVRWCDGSVELVFVRLSISYEARLFYFSLRSAWCLCFFLLFSCCCKFIYPGVGIGIKCKLTSWSVSQWHFSLALDVWHFHCDAFMLFIYIVGKYKTHVWVRWILGPAYFLPLLITIVSRALFKPCL